MRIFISLFPLLLATVVSAQPGGALPELVKLTQQDKPRPHPRLKLPKNHAAGPLIPGLMQGAVPQGLAFWPAQNWLLISCHFHHDAGTPPSRPSVVVALDAETKKVVRCLTLVEASGKMHAGHVGGLAVSNKYLWVGSGQLYRAPLADLLAAPRHAHLRLQKLFHAECNASFLSYHDRRVWVGEFVAVKDPRFKGNPAHHLKDRSGHNVYAWAAGYALDADENPKGAALGNVPPPAAILAIREHVQGMAFLHNRIILSTSFGKKKNSILAEYRSPFPGESNKPHQMVKVKVGDAKVPLWFLDGKNHVKNINFPPMSEGITAYHKRLAVICESGAAHYLKGGNGPLDRVIYLDP